MVSDSIKEELDKTIEEFFFKNWFPPGYPIKILLSASCYDGLRLEIQKKVFRGHNQFPSSEEMRRARHLITTYSTSYGAFPIVIQFDEEGFVIPDIALVEGK